MNSDFRPVNKGVKINKLRCEGLKCDVAAMSMTNVEDNVAVSLIFLQRFTAIFLSMLEKIATPAQRPCAEL